MNLTSAVWGCCTDKMAGASCVDPITVCPAQGALAMGMGEPVQAGDSKPVWVWSANAGDGSLDVSLRLGADSYRNF